MLKGELRVKAVKILLDVFDPFDNRWSSKIDIDYQRWWSHRSKTFSNILRAFKQIMVNKRSLSQSR